MHRLVSALLLLGLFLALAACGTPRGRVITESSDQPDGITVIPDQEATEPPSEIPELNSSTRAEAYARFATGLTHEFNAQPESAMAQFHAAALADPSHEMLAVELARRYLAAQQNDKALEVLKKSAERPRSTGLVHAWLGRAWRQAGRTNDALASNLEAIRRSPLHLAGYENLFSLRMAMKQPQEAWKVLEQAASQDDADSPFLMALAELYLGYARDQKDDQEAGKAKALELLRKVATLKPKSPPLLQRLGELLTTAGDPKAAAEIYLGLLEDFGSSPNIRDLLRARLADIYLQDKDKSRAVELLEAIVRDHPTRYPQAYQFLGTIALEQKNHARAADYFARALQLTPENEQLHIDLALAQLQAGEKEKAVIIMEQARARFPRSFFVHVYSGIVHSRLEQHEKAVSFFTTAEVLASATDAKLMTHQVYFQIGMSCERNKDYAQAEKYFTKCLELSPNFAEALNYLGYMWAERGEKLDQARVHLEKAVRLEPKNPAFLDSLAWVYFKLKDYPRALPLMEQAIALVEKPDATLYDHLGDILAAMGQAGKARDAWKKSVEIEDNPEVRKKLGS